MTDSTKETDMEPMASVAARTRLRRLANALIPAATVGKAGISHRF